MTIITGKNERVLCWESDELVEILIEALQDDFSNFEYGVTQFVKRNGFSPDDDDEGEIYASKEIKAYDMLRKKFCRAIVKALLNPL